MLSVSMSAPSATSLPLPVRHASELVPSQLPAAPSQLPAEPSEVPTSGTDRTTLSSVALWRSAEAMASNPVGASMLSQNEQVDAMAETVYYSQLSRQAIQTYSETYQMATEQTTTESTQPIAA